MESIYRFKPQLEPAACRKIKVLKLEWFDLEIYSFQKSDPIKQLDISTYALWLYFTVPS